MLVIAHRQENRALVREVVAVVVQQVVTTWAKLLRAHFEKLEQMVEVFGGLAQGDSLNRCAVWCLAWLTTLNSTAIEKLLAKDDD